MSLPVEEALASPDRLIRAFAILDRRVGRRRLRTLTVGRDDHPLVRRFYEIRQSTDQAPPGEGVPADGTVSGSG